MISDGGTSAPGSRLSSGGAGRGTEGGGWVWLSGVAVRALRIRGAFLLEGGEGFHGFGAAEAFAEDGAFGAGLGEDFLAVATICLR